MPWCVTTVVLVLPDHDLTRRAVLAFPREPIAHTWNRSHPPYPPCYLPRAVFSVSVFHFPSFSSTVVLSWRHGISTGIQSVSCAPTATSTSNRRATSSWRGSCTAKLMQGLARGPQRATTPLLSIPKLNDVLYRPEHTHSSTLTQEDIHGFGQKYSKLLAPNLKPRLLDVFLIVTEEKGAGDRCRL